ncbi:glycoside hydrolase family 2 protein [Chitinophaga sp. XS-30]|uniref:glycoside hydrolase family 2 protein n=1 Tax=Chitinophaga sp. XS-30 TaxID=2604421 RepID=UPI0011DD01C7|nr:sugar-binding domain-containing protein [Chitinophaga sp. XS-30]QEH42551.1 glycoside hydrolase family 2 [Chitinophaga sp. XS-30]
MQSRLISTLHTLSIAEKWYFLLLGIFFLLPVSASAQTLSLAGRWQYRLDPQDTGIQQQWFLQDFAGSITLPGTLDDAGIGAASSLNDESVNKAVLLMLTRRHSYIGPAWYSKDVVIPAGWKGKYIELLLERVLWDTRIWVDGQEAGTQESLIAPHRYDLGKLLTPGRHKLVIRIDNRKRYDMSTRDMAHAYTNGTQIIWNGVIGRMELSAREPVFIEQLQVYPDVKGNKARAVISFRNVSGRAKQTRLKVIVTGRDNRRVYAREMPVNIKTGAAVQELDIPLKDAGLWDEFDPCLYTLRATLTSGVADTRNTTFGMRSLTNDKGLLQLNGRRIFLRGTLECNIFPLTGYPPMDHKGWEKVFASAKAYGLNHLRFHSWCPPEAAFAVADSMGFYLQIELPFWNKNAGQDESMNAWLAAEAQHIIREYGNHPSFCFWSMGNELEGDFSWLSAMVTRLKKQDPRHLYTTTSFSFQRDHGRWPEPEDDFFITQYTKKGWVRGQGIFNTIPPDFITDYTRATDSLPVPLITHEIGQYSVFPNMEEISKYTGVLEPLNFKAIRKDLERKGLLPLAEQYLMASGKFAANLYKEEIERALKTKGMSGFQLLDLHDFPGQGTALIGILDAFWDSKGLVAAEEHRRYCGAVVPLLRFDKAVYTNAETFVAAAEVANFSKGALLNSTAIWAVHDQSSRQLAGGELPPQQIAIGNGQTLGTFSFDLKDVKTAKALTITLSLKGTGYRNRWSIWVYPAKVPAMRAAHATDIPGEIAGHASAVSPRDAIYTRSVTEALRLLEQGKNVLLNPDTLVLKGVEGRFAPVFWSPVHFPAQPGTMGILCDPTHPAFRHFPTAFYSDWQWWDLITSSKTMIIDSLPEVTPVVRVIDNFFRNRKMANVIEVKVSRGKLLLTSIDLERDLDKRHAARQFRYSLERYMNSGDFEPVVEWRGEEVMGLIR